MRYGQPHIARAGGFERIGSGEPVYGVDSVAILTIGQPDVSL